MEKVQKLMKMKKRVIQGIGNKINIMVKENYYIIIPIVIIMVYGIIMKKDKVYKHILTEISIQGILKIINFMVMVFYIIMH